MGCLQSKAAPETRHASAVAASTRETNVRAPSGTLSTQPTGPLTLASLPSDALSRIFFFLGAPITSYSRESFLSPRHTDSNDSPAVALSRTCKSLEELHRTEVVTCVDLSDAPCSCGLPAALEKHPSADAAVLRKLRCENLEAAFCGDRARPLGQLRALCLKEIPSSVFADALVSAVPRLQELVITSPGWTTVSPEGRWGPSTAQNELLGRTRMLKQLPAGLCRLTVDHHFTESDEEMQMAFWGCIGSMESLEVLEVTGLYAPSKSTVTAMGRCRRLWEVRMELETDRVWGVKLAELVTALPPGLKKLILDGTEEGDNGEMFFDLPTPLSAGYWARLLELEHLHLGRLSITTLGAVMSVAPRLRKLELEDVSVEYEAIIPRMRNLEEFKLGVVAGVNDSLLMQVFLATDKLREAFFDASPMLSDTGFSAAIRNAACAKSLHVLRVGGFVNVGEKTAEAIGTHFLELEELDLEHTHITATGIESLGRGCQKLQKASFNYCSGFDDAAATAIGVHFPRLEKLELVETGITAAGLISVRRGCPAIAELSLKHCEGIDDAAGREIARCMSRLKRLDLGGTSISGIGLKTLGRGCSRLTDLNLRGCHHMNVMVAKGFGVHFLQLKSLDLSETNLATKEMRFVTRWCPELTLLRLFSCGNINDSAAKAISNGLPQLKTLDLSATIVTPAGLLPLKKGCPHLQELFLLNCERIDDATAEAVWDDRRVWRLHLLRMPGGSCRSI